MIEMKYNIPKAGAYEVLVAGGGVSGVAAALSASREGKRVLLIEKGAFLGGLATMGLINLFVPMCNGRGIQIIRGMADEFLRLAVKYGYDDIPQPWLNGENHILTDSPENNPPRLRSHFDTGMFALTLNRILADAGVDVMYDTMIIDAVMDGGHCRGLVAVNKSGMSFYAADVVVDATGDADILHKAKVPTVQGCNYFTSVMHRITLDSCRAALEAGDIGKAVKWAYGGNANLYGKNHPECRPLYGGTDGAGVSEFIQENQLVAFEKFKDEDRRSRAVVTMPSMPQFRTTRRIAGDYTLSPDDAYRHFYDSLTAVCDMDRRDYLFEIPYRSLVRTGFDNLITAGRSISADGYAWDVTRVIPPAIITGQAAGLAASISLKYGMPIFAINTEKLQEKLDSTGVLIHFDDAWIPDKISRISETTDHI